MQDSTPAIVYEGIEKILKSITISGSINRGEVVAVLAPGCGKSTLLVLQSPGEN